MIITTIVVVETIPKSKYISYPETVRSVGICTLMIIQFKGATPDNCVWSSPCQFPSVVTVVRIGKPVGSPVLSL